MTCSAVGAQRPVHSHLPVAAGTSGRRSYGVEAFELARLAGLTMDDWQTWFLTESLRFDTVGRWDAFESALIVPRQNGKGALLEARQLFGLFYLEEPLQVHTAHEFKTAFEHFVRISQLVEGCPDLDRKVQRIRRGAGEQAIELKSGCRLRFLARSTGSGRGLTGDTVYLDEAFALTSPMMGALLPTLSAVPNPQIWYTSSAPRRESEVLHALRKRGRGGGSDRLFYAEWGLSEDAEVDDVANWRLANPALGIRITEEFVAAELDAMRGMPEEFLRERLGVPEDPDGEGSVVDMARWAELADPDSTIVSNHQLALDVAFDRKWASFAAAGRRADGKVHVEVFERRPGTDWVVERAIEAHAKSKLPVRILSGSPAASFIPLLAEQGVPVEEVPPGDHARAVGQFLDAVENKQLAHPGGMTLRSALSGAVLRVSAGDASVWARKSSKVDISSLVAATVALGGVAARQSVGLFVAVT
jgi:phage terminase large subunit-like protein